MYIIVSSDIVEHCQTTALGHEIHFSRYILCQMLHNKNINDTDIIVTRHSDRFILYTKLFKKVIDQKEFQTLKVTDNNIINLTSFMNIDTVFNDDNKINIININAKCNFDIRTLLYEQNAPNVNYLLNNIDYISIGNKELIKKEFIIIHIRVIGHCYSLEVIQKIINFIEYKYYNFNIICYSADSNIRLLTNKVHIQYINNFSLYASLMNHELCKAVISEISGGGELSQYCHNKNIYLYPNHYYLDICNITKKLNTKTRPSLMLHSTFVNGSTLYLNSPSNEGSTDAVLHKFSSLDNMFHYLTENDI